MHADQLGHAPPAPTSRVPVQPSAGATVERRLDWYATVARWAPSKHNTQPWRFVVRDGGLDLWPETTRMLPETDPHRRELVLSCGAALQLACVAARAAGRLPRVQALPTGPDGPLARLTEAGPWDTTERDLLLLAAVDARFTDRGPLDARLLPTGLPFLLQSEADALGASLRLVVSPGDRATLTDLVLRADHLLVEHTRADEELRRWMPGANPSAFRRVPHVGPSEGGADDPLLAVLCSPLDDVPQWLAAGRALAAVLLQATRVGVSASYLNQPVQVPALRVQMREQLTLPGFAQLVLRIGVGHGAPSTTRLQDAVITLSDPP